MSNNYSNTYDGSHKGYDVMSNSKLNIDLKITDTIINCIEHYSGNYSKSFVVTFNLNYPREQQYDSSNKAIITFMDRFTKYLESKTIRHGYVWVREQASSWNHHYHIMMVLDGNKIQNRFGIMKEAERIWGEVIGSDPAGLVDYSWDSAMLRKDSNNYASAINNCVFNNSYLAKTNSKELTPHGLRRYGYSKLK